VDVEGSTSALAKESFGGGAARTEEAKSEHETARAVSDFMIRKWLHIGTIFWGCLNVE
jgi:hypothetical protein